VAEDVVDFVGALGVESGWPSRMLACGWVASFNDDLKSPPMTETNRTLVNLLQKHDDGDFMRAVTETVLQIQMEHDVDGMIGAERYERSDGRHTYRNGCRDRELKTRLGASKLRVPKLRQGYCFPGFLEPRRTSEKALVAVIREAWIGAGFRHGRSMIWCRRWGCLAFRRARCPGFARTQTSGCMSSLTAR
jgi:hypothetical protein